MKINMEEAGSQLSRLGRLAWAGEEVVICRDGEPYLRLTAHRSALRVPGLWEGRVRMAPDFDETPADLIDAFEGVEDRG